MKQKLTTESRRHAVEMNAPVIYYAHICTYTVSQKNCAKLFLSELLQIFTNFHNFWQKNGKEAKIM